MQVPATNRYLPSDILSPLDPSTDPFHDGNRFSFARGHFSDGSGHLSGAYGGLNTAPDLRHLCPPDPALESSEDSTPGSMEVSPGDQQRRLAIFKTFTDQGQGSGGGK